MSSPEDDLLANEELIEAAAATWHVEVENGLTPAQARAFDLWRQSDPRHAAAYERFSRAAETVAKWPLLAANEDFDATRRSRPRRAAGWFALGGLAAGLAIAAAAWAWQARRAAEIERYATADGGYQRIALADGSTIELNANTEVRVHYTAARRDIALVRGEAFFSVAKNKARPFVVAAGSLAVTAVGTAFNVKTGEERVNVLVTEGKVAVREPAMNDVALAAGENASIALEAPAPRAEVQKIEIESMRDALEWRQPKLVFANTPLSEVVAQFNLRNQLQISIEDPALAARPFVGTFRADNVSAFVRLLEEQGEVVVERRDHARFILRRPGTDASASTPEPTK